MADSLLVEELKYLHADRVREIELIKYDIDQCMYYYGEQFKNPRERSVEFTVKNATHKGWGTSRISRCIKRIAGCRFRSQSMSPARQVKTDKCVLSQTYFGFNEELEKIGLRALSYQGYGEHAALNEELAKKVDVLLQKLSSPEIGRIANEEMFAAIAELREDLLRYYSKLDIKALVVPYDMPFMERLMLDVFKELGKLSFIFLHGLPGRYNVYDDNRSDYLIVWGEKIKDAYIKAGFKAEKILVSGHPYYTGCADRAIEFDLRDVLVITKTMSIAQHSDMVRLADRGNLIGYLYSIQEVLLNCGVKSARLRPHPSERGEWYLRHIDSRFYSLDRESLMDSLKRATIVVGSTSTVLLESTYYGKNYLVYEPLAKGLDLVGFPLVPPFDGSDVRVPVANDESQLRALMRDHRCVDAGFLADYIKQPFDISWINEMLA